MFLDFIATRDDNQISIKQNTAHCEIAILFSEDVLNYCT